MRRYIFKLYPSKEQAAVLHDQRKMMADLWNALKQRIEDVYRRERRMLSFFDLTNEITELRHECPEWAIVPAITAHRVAKHLTESYAAFFRRLRAGEEPGYPRWQARERATTVPLGTMSKTGWKIEQRTDNLLSWRLHYKSVTTLGKTWIHGRGRLPADVRDWRNADIIWRDARWWLSICVDIAPRRRPGIAPVRVEFDLVDCFAVVSSPGSPGQQREARVKTEPGSPGQQREMEDRLAVQTRLAGSTARARLEIEDQNPEGLVEAQILQDKLDVLKSERDLSWPRGRRYDDEEKRQRHEANSEISRLSARIARVRSNALHVWTARIVAMASDITVIAPPVRRNTRTPRGNEKSWGAEVKAVSALNRNTLSQAPAMAIAMLKYKAEEAGIRCDVVEDDAPMIAVGGDLITAGKQLRRARRSITKDAA